jgi:hypothetical protein
VKNTKGRMLAVAALALAVGAAKAQNAAPSPTPDFMRQMMDESDRLIREKQQRVSAVLAFYDQMQSLRLEGTMRLYRDDPKARWIGNFVDGVTQAEWDKWEKQYRTFFPRRFKLELKDGIGTITYYELNSPKKAAVCPTRVYLDNSVGQYSGSIEQGLTVRITLGTPRGGKITIYASDLFKEDIKVPDDPPIPADFWKTTPKNPPPPEAKQPVDIKG